MIVCQYDFREGLGIIALFQLLGEDEGILAVCSQTWGYNGVHTPHCPRSQGLGNLGDIQGSLCVSVVLGSSLGSQTEVSEEDRKSVV